MKKRIALLALSLATATGTAGAGSLAVSAKGSTLGFGMELTRPLTPAFNLRAGFNKFSYSLTQTIDQVDYAATLDLQSFSLLGDWHPFHGGLRLTGGVLVNGNELRGTATPSANVNFTIGDTDYSSKDITANATISFNKLSPYLGIGYDRVSRHGRGLGLTADVGVVFQGSPKVDFAVTGPDALSVLTTDIQAEVDQIEQDISDYKVYPVVAFGVIYQF